MAAWRNRFLSLFFALSCLSSEYPFHQNKRLRHKAGYYPFHRRRTSIRYSPPAISHSTIPTFITPSSFRNGGIPHGLSSTLRLANPSLHKYSTFHEKNPLEFSRKSIRNLVNLREMYDFFARKTFSWSNASINRKSLPCFFVVFPQKGRSRHLLSASPLKTFIYFCATSRIFPPPLSPGGKGMEALNQCGSAITSGLSAVSVPPNASENPGIKKTACSD